jgi:hypothetical protein
MYCIAIDTVFHSRQYFIVITPLQSRQTFTLNYVCRLGTQLPSIQRCGIKRDCVTTANLLKQVKALSARCDTDAG